MKLCSMTSNNVLDDVENHDENSVKVSVSET